MAAQEAEPVRLKGKDNAANSNLNVKGKEVMINRLPDQSPETNSNLIIIDYDADGTLNRKNSIIATQQGSYIHILSTHLSQHHSYYFSQFGAANLAHSQPDHQSAYQTTRT